MDPVANIDRLVLLLRRKLETRAAGARNSAPQARGRLAGSNASGIQALAAAGGVDDREFRRAVVQNLLAERLDRRLVNEAQFQQVVARVTEALEQEATASALLDRVVGELRAAAR